MPALTNYRLVEPHPSVPNTSRPAIHTSRGGAGNVINLKNTPTTDSQSAMGPPSRTRLNTHKPRTFQSGRGGAGNVHNGRERAIFSFDEELERDLRRVAPVYHVGRGGAGNMIHSSSSSAAAATDSQSQKNHDLNSLFGGSTELARKVSAGSQASTSSAESNADRAMAKARSSIERGWGKLRGVA